MEAAAVVSPVEGSKIEAPDSTESVAPMPPQNSTRPSLSFVPAAVMLG